MGLGAAAAITSAGALARSGGVSSGGSANNAMNTSQSYSASDAALAREFSAEQARLAYERSKELWKMQADYNSAEAQKSRDWSTQMANTTYQRTMKDMIAAGINPILAAGMGLSGDSVTSGATAQAGTPQNFMASTVAGSQSASQSYGESHGNSWNQAESGLAYLADVIGGALQAMNSANKIEIAINGLEDLFNKPGDNDNSTGEYTKYDTGLTGIIEKGVHLIGGSIDKFKDFFNTGESKQMGAQKGSLQKDNPAYYKYQYHNNGL